MTNPLTAVRRLLSEDELRRIVFAAILSIATVLGVQARAQESAFYIVKEPIVRTVALNKLALSTIVVYQLANTATVLYMGSLGGPTTFAAMVAKEAAQYAQFPLVTSGVLKSFSNDDWRALLEETKKLPGILDARLFTTSDVLFKGPFANQIIGQGYLVLQADHDLNQDAVFVKAFGSSIKIQDLRGATVTFTFNDGVQEHSNRWTTTLDNLVGSSRFPLEVIQQWRTRAQELGSNHGYWNRHIGRQYLDSMKIEALIVLPTGEGVHLGSVMSGSAMVKFLAMGLTQSLARRIWPAIPAGTEGELPSFTSERQSSNSCFARIKRAVARIAIKN